MSFENPWNRLTLKAAGVSLIDCDHRTPVAVANGVPYIAIPQLRGGRISLDAVRQISEADYAEWTRKLSPQLNDVIVVRRCNSGESAYVPAGLKCAIGQNLVVLRADGKKLMPEYLRWLVRGTEWWDEVRKYINVGAVFDSLRCRDIPLFELPVPPLTKQEEIARVLAALDDRITLLRETNATLEAIAQALFKSWFVDFDPVRAKMEGRAPEGMDQGTAGLFPDELEDSALGLVPKGWRQRTMAEVSTVGIGKTPPRKEPHWFSEDANHVRWVSIRDMGAMGVYAARTSEFLTQDAVKKFGVRQIPNNTVLMSFKMTIGRVAITDGEMTTNEAIAHFSLHSDAYTTTEYIYLHLKQFDFSSLSSTSSIADAVNSKSVREIPILVPTETVLQAFQGLIAPLFAKLKVAEKHVQTLVTLRDTLVPRLISGQLRLPENTDALAAEVCASSV